MGNENSSSIQQDTVVISREMYSKNQNYCDNLEHKIRTQKSEIEDLETKIKRLESNNTRNEQENQQLTIELQKYESLPIIKLILKVNSQINDIDDKIVKLSNTKQVDKNEIIREEIDELRKNIATGARNLPNNVLNSLSEKKTSEIWQLQEAIKKDELTAAAKPSFSDLLQKLREKLQKISENFMLSLAKDAAKVSKELSALENDTNEMPVSEVNPKYERLKAILIEQENKILKLQLAMPKSKPKKLGRSDDSLLFCNIPEESTDFPSDHDKVCEILKIFQIYGVSERNCQVARVGNRTPRSLRVQFPNVETVELVLRSKHKLNSSPFSHVRIYGNKNEDKN